MANPPSPKDEKKNSPGNELAENRPKEKRLVEGPRVRNRTREALGRGFAIMVPNTMRRPKSSSEKD